MKKNIEKRIVKLVDYSMILLRDSYRYKTQHFAIHQLIGRLNILNDEEFSELSFKKITDQTGISNMSARNAIEYLVRNNYIKQEKSFKKNFKGYRYHYIEPVKKCRVFWHNVYKDFTFKVSEVEAGSNIFKSSYLMSVNNDLSKDIRIGTNEPIDDKLLECYYVDTLEETEYFKRLNTLNSREG